MLLYTLFSVLAGIVVLNLGGWLDPVFNIVGLGAGLRTIALQAPMALILCVFWMRTKKFAFPLSLVGKPVLLWCGWLVLLLSRTDFDDAYAVTKLGRIFLLHFVTIVLIIAAYRSGPNQFNRAFLPSFAFVAACLLVTFALAPQTFAEVGTGRMTVENVSGVWLARAFGVAILFLVLKSSWPNWLRLAGIAGFAVGMLATGSRGPFLSLLLVVFALYAVRYRGSRRFWSNVIAAVAVAIVSFGLVWYKYSEQVAEYLYRGSSDSLIEQSKRDVLFTQAIEDWYSSPLIGVGLGKYAKTSASSQVGTMYADDQFLRLYPHNLILEVLAETGLVGLLVFSILIMPGRWMLDVRSRYGPFFLLTGLFAMTSGDLPFNSAFFAFAMLCWLESRGREARRRSTRTRSTVATMSAR